MDGEEKRPRTGAERQRRWRELSFKRYGRQRLRNPLGYDPQSYLPPPDPPDPPVVLGDPIGDILLGGDLPPRDPLPTAGEGKEVDPERADQQPVGDIAGEEGGFTDGDSVSEAGSGDGTADGASGDNRSEDGGVAHSEGGGEEGGVQGQEGGDEEAGGGDAPEGESSEGEEQGRQGGLPFDQYNHAALVGDAPIDINKVNGEFLLFVHSRFQLSVAGAEEVYRHFVARAEYIVRAKRDGDLLRSADNLMKRARKGLPQVYTKIWVVGGEEGSPPVEWGPFEELPRHLTTFPELRKDCYVELRALRELVYEVHQVPTDRSTGEPLDDRWREVIISSDDVQESKSALTQLKFMCILFRMCGKALPWFVVRCPTPTHKVIPMEYMCELFAQLNVLGLVVKLYVGDKKERNGVKGLVASTGFWSCDHCTMRGTSKQLDPRTRGGSGKGRTVYWSCKQQAGVPRSRENMIRHLRRWQEEVAEAAESGRRPRGRGFKGVVADSPLYVINDFDPVTQALGDPLHLLDLGLTKKLYYSTCLGYHSHQLRRSHARGKERDNLVGTSSLVAAKLDKTSKEWKEGKRAAIDSLVHRLRVPSEYERRPRKVVHGQYKANEWHQVACYMSPVIARDVTSDYPAIAKIWALFGFLYRAVAGSTADFRTLDRSRVLDRAMGELSRLYEDTFGGETMTSNEHSAFTHLLWMRRQVDNYTDMSSERFEGFYGQGRTCYRPGTPQTLKQLFCNTLGRYKHRHTCTRDRRLRVREKGAARSDDTILHVAGRGFLRVTGKAEDGAFFCRPLLVDRFEDGLGLAVALPWEMVGVHTLVGTSQGRREVVRPEEADGKGVVYDDVILLARKEWLLR